MSILDSPFELTGELSEDVRCIKIDKAPMMERLLARLKGKKLQMKIQVLKIKRSLAQNRWLWGVSHVSVGSFLKDTQGEQYSKEAIHDFTIQHILNDGSSGKTVCFDLNEFKGFCNDLYSLSQGKKKEWVLEKALTFVQPYLTNLTVRKIFDKRVVSNLEYKTTSKLATKEFNEMKDKIQKYWAEFECYIPDPTGNNFITDYAR